MNNPESNLDLTDISQLDVDTYFYCINGEWQGVICLNNEGGKCVLVFTPHESGCIPITEENKWLQIEKGESDEF